MDRNSRPNFAARSAEEERLRANEEAVAALSITLGQARIGFTTLAPHSTSLEELFLGMTEGDPGDARTDHEEAA